MGATVGGWVAPGAHGLRAACGTRGNRVAGQALPEGWVRNG
jgi:FAD/FMN-containing dehydrogenase